MIKVTHLSKHFKIKKRRPGIIGSIQALVKTETDTIKAVDDITFHINSGELVGYIGPNGAGKSTTIKMLTGILTPTTGNILVNDINPSKERKKNAYQIGVVFGQRTQLWTDLPVEESFDLLKSIYKIDDKVYKQKLEFFFDLLGLKDFFKQQARKLSLGQRMKADLAASLIHSPSVLFLDEPTIGLDIIVKEKVREFIREINHESKVTVILTTHDIQDIEYLANRIMIIDKGKIVYDGNLSNFNSLVGNDSFIDIHFASPIGNLEIPLPFQIKEKKSETNYTLIAPENEPLSSLLQILQNQKVPIQEINRQKPDLAVALKTMYEGRNEL